MSKRPPSGSGRPFTPFSTQLSVDTHESRLHDLRHSFAIQAVLLGVPIPVVARLLEHRNVSMTLRYAHVRDVFVEVAAERIAATIERLLEPGIRSSSEASGQLG